MKACLADLYRKVSAQIRKELRIKDAESRLHLYKHYIPLIVNAISESIKVDSNKLSEAFTKLAEKHIKGENTDTPITKKEDKITEERIEEEIKDKSTTEVEDKDPKEDRDRYTLYAAKRRNSRESNKKSRSLKKTTITTNDQVTLDTFNKPKKVQVEGN